MQQINLHDKSFRLLIEYDEIQANIKKLAETLNQDYKDDEVPLFVSVLNGSFMFTADLLKNLEFLCELSFLKVSSYSGTQSTGTIEEVIGLTTSVEGRSVVLIEDIVDSGTTIVKLYNMLKDAGAKKIEICTLLLKPEAYKKDIPVKYVAMKIPNDFIVGYGLDYNELGRQYKDIYVLDNSAV